MKNRSVLIKTFMESWSQGYRSMVGNRDKAFSAFGLNRAQVELLYFLSHRKDTLVKDVASNLNTTSSAATQLLNGLVLHGLVERVGNPEDRREVRLCLTALGKTKLNDCQKSKLVFVTTLLSEITDSEIAFMISISQRINATRLKIQSQKETTDA